MYILTILKCPLKTYVIGLHNPIPMNIFFTIKDFLYNCKETAENKLLKQKNNQKQPFTYVFQNRCFLKIRNMHRKTPVLESLFNKLAGQKACNFIKKRFQHRCFPKNIAEFSRIAFFIQHLLWLSSNNYLQYWTYYII